MDQILSSFMSLPTMAVGAIFAGIGGGLGALIANFAVKNLKSKKLALVAQGGLMIGTMAVFSILGGHLQHSFAAEKAIADLKKHRLFSILFDLHPDSESEMKNKLRTIISSTPRTSRFQESQQASAQIVAKYFQKHLPTASADDTHRLLLRNVAVMRKFEKQTVTVRWVLYG